MKRVVVAAIMVAAVGLIGFTAPARSATMYAATMVTVNPAGFKYAHGVCGNSTGNGDFQVEVGDSITWTNCTQADHTVTGTGNSFGSSDHVVPGSSVTYTFATPGTIPYHCEIHTSMTGTITVTGVEVTTTLATTTTTTATTVKPPTTSTSAKATTTTTDNLNGVFDESSTTSTTETTLFTTDTTRALGEGGDDSTSPGLIALLIVGLGTVGTAGALLVRRMRAGPVDPS